MNNTEHPDIWAIIPAAGIGSRMNSDTPKQYLPLNGKTVLETTVEKLLSVGRVSGVVLALNPQDTYFSDTPLAKNPKVYIVEGGSERSESVLNALNYCQLELAVHDRNAWALVHDAARPCVTLEKIESLIDYCLDELPNDNSSKKISGAILAVPASDTVKRVDDCRTISNTEDRNGLWMAHTPQLFPLQVLQIAINKCFSNSVSITDEASAIEALGRIAKVVHDRRDNIKITMPEDLAWAEIILKNQEAC